MLFCLNDKLRIEIVDPPYRFKKFLCEELNFSDDFNNIKAENDVIIEFKDSLNFSESAIVHKAPVAYDEIGVFWFDPNHKIARIDFDNFDNGLTKLTVCKEFNTHFLYILILYLLSFKSIRDGGVFCHASAVLYRGKTIIFPAWRHVGKTNLMLELLKDGADLISDDGIILYKNGELLTFSKRLHLLYFNFLSNPDLLENVDNQTHRLIEFVERARGGQYDLEESTIEEVQKLIRVRLPNTAITNREFKPQKHKCDLIVHLNKKLGEKGISHEIDQIDLERLTVKTAESSLFELSHFIEAYRVSSLVESKESWILDNADEEIRKISKQAFSSASDLLELSFSDTLNSLDAKKLIDEHLRANET